MSNKKLTTSSGTPVVDNNNVLTAGRHGPMLL
ncbi:TPA: catalase, partial [Serratia marcescens]|nr:catalase [Serratia marcescens]